MTGIINMLKSAFGWGDAQANKAAEAIANADPQAALKLEITKQKERIIQWTTELGQYQAHVDSLARAIDGKTNEEKTLTDNITKRTKRMMELEKAQQQGSTEYQEISEGRRMKAVQLQGVKNQLVDLRKKHSDYSALVEERLQQLRDADVTVKMQEGEAGNLAFEADMTALDAKLSAANGDSAATAASEGAGRVNELIEKVRQRNDAARNAAEIGRSLTKVDQFDRVVAKEQKLAAGDDLLAQLDAEARGSGTTTPAQ